jgi:hypothetical protein
MRSLFRIEWSLRALPALALVSGCSLNPQPLPPEQSSDASSAAVSGGGTLKQGSGTDGASTSPGECAGDNCGTPNNNGGGGSGTGASDDGAVPPAPGDAGRDAAAHECDAASDAVSATDAPARDAAEEAAVGDSGARQDAASGDGPPQ